MSKNQYLELRFDTWQFRRRVPKQLAHLYAHKTYIIKSLGTSSIKKARILRDRINGEIAAQLQQTYSPERIQFKALVEQTIKYREELTEGYVDFEDVLPKTPIVAAAYKEVIHGKTNHAYTITLKETLSNLLIKKGDKSTEETRHKLRNTVERFLRFLRMDDIALSAIHKKQVVSFIDDMGLEYAHGTITAHLSRLRSVWSHAYKMGDIEQKVSPFCDHDLSAYKGEASQRKQLFTADQMKAIVKDVPIRLQPLTRLAIYSGARLSELCNAHEEVIEGVRCMVILKGKTASASRIVPLCEQVSDITLPLGITTKEAGRAFSRFKTANITKDSSRSFHSLRAHFATAAQRANVAEYDAANALGHKTGQTMSYGHYARQDVKRLKQAVDAVAAQIDKEWLS